MMSVPVEALGKLKCSICHKYLSYFPIYIEQNKLHPICGRCSPHINRDHFTRNEPYESLCEYLTFPCTYECQGCIEKLTPSEVPDHEKNCSFRIIACLMGCAWSGSVHDIHDHFLEQHPEAILKNGEFEMDFMGSYVKYNLLIYEDEVFIMQRNFDRESEDLNCSVSVWCLKVVDSVSKYKYAVRMKNCNGELEMNFPPKPTDGLHENITDINIEELKKSLEDPVVIVATVNIVRDIDEVSPTSKKNDTEVNNKMLSELECPVCMEYIIPPIYQCIAGHSICGDCKLQVVQCPTCKREIKDTQNFSLEKMAMFLTYPCKFSELGCSFASEPGKIRKHQKYCLHGTQPCPVGDYENCTWSGLTKNTYSHIMTQHIDCILDVDTIVVFIDNSYFNKEEKLCFIKKVNNYLFKLHFAYMDNAFYWSMQLMGPDEKAALYNFEVDIIDMTNNNKKIFLRSSCTPLVERTQVFNNIDQYVFLKIDQIKSFITDEFAFQIRVTKNIS